MRSSAQPARTARKVVEPGVADGSGWRTLGSELIAVARTTTVVPGTTGRSASPAAGG